MTYLPLCYKNQSFFFIVPVINSVVKYKKDMDLVERISVSFHQEVILILKAQNNCQAQILLHTMLYWYHGTMMLLDQYFDVCYSTGRLLYSYSIVLT